VEAVEAAAVGEELAHNLNAHATLYNDQPAAFRANQGAMQNGAVLYA
jgi:hypothetical protein